MNVAPATSTALRPFSFMTAHGDDTAVTGAGGRTPAQPSTDPASTGPSSSGTAETEPLINRFPTIAFSYDVDASRLVMQYRDPANGKTVSQIPTEAALKQYKEAQQQERNAARADALAVTVGGADGRSDAGGSGVSGRNGGGSAAGNALPAAAAHIASVNAAPVAHFTPAAPHRAASTGAARVNVVI